MGRGGRGSLEFLVVQGPTTGRPDDDDDDDDREREREHLQFVCVETSEGRIVACSLVGSVPSYSRGRCC